MGLFSFLKNTGSKLFSKKEEEKAVQESNAADAAAKQEAINRSRATLLQGVIESMGIRVENLDIQVNDDQATVYGQVKKQADKEKLILAIGNTEGIATVEDRISVVTPEPEATFYEVKSGDSLSKIAKAHYGDAMKYMLIFEANKPMLEDPNRIYPGQKLRIPPIS